ncbi:MAG: ImmA/IrrE family metallo-endopeptidase [Limnothrix sp. RL_2_0]|nr:ImmA/IrrE family metallo-endopeptidase [Limnothrix sp. RL_2_0]
MNIQILPKNEKVELLKRLQEARKNAGMTQADAAKVIGVSRTTIVALEKGERSIKSLELVKLAEAYNRDIKDLLRKENQTSSTLNVQFRSEYKSIGDKHHEIEGIIENLEKLYCQYAELEILMSDPLIKSYPKEYSSNLPLERLAESIAQDERQRLGLGDAPISNLRDLLECNVGLKIFYVKMPSKYSEVYSYKEEWGGCIAINSNHPEDRQRWSLAHGYLHFLAHRHKSIVDFSNLNERYQRIPESEKLAEKFPEYFLMPTSGIIRRFQNIIEQAGNQFTPSHLFNLAYEYKVSIQALCLRLEGMNLLPTGTYDNLKSRGLKIRETQSKLGLPERTERNDIFPLHYQYLAISALDRGEISEGKFAEFMMTDRLTSRKIADQLRLSGSTEDSIYLFPQYSE